MKKTLFFLLLFPALAFGQATGFVISNKPSGGAIGTAATTVDVVSNFNINQTTAGQTLTVPNLTNASAGKIIFINNVGSVSFILSPGGTLSPGKGVVMRWTGSLWNVSGNGSGSTNPTDRFIPYNNAGIFGDSPLSFVNSGGFNYIKSADTTVYSSSNLKTGMSFNSLGGFFGYNSDGLALTGNGGQFRPISSRARMEYVLSGGQIGRIDVGSSGIDMNHDGQISATSPSITLADGIIGNTLTIDTTGFSLFGSDIGPGTMLGLNTNDHLYSIPNNDTGYLHRDLSGAFTYKTPAGGAGTVTSIATTSPITGGTITTTGTIGINNAAADGSTKGAASFTASDFNASSGNISIDYTNGQAASGSNKGLLTSSDWTTFNGKESALTFSSPLSRSTNTISIDTSKSHGNIATFSDVNLKAPKASPTFTGTVTIPSPFTLGATSVTSTGTQLNYLNAATGTTGTTSTNLVYSTSPTLVTPILGIPTSGTLTNCTGLPLTTGVTGTLPIANGGTNATDATTARNNLGVSESSYTPTLFNTTNVAGSTAYVTNYYRVGNLVTVFGEVDIDVTTTAIQTELGMSLPIASNFTAVPDLAGSAIVISNVAGANVFGLYADITNDRVFFIGRPTSVVNIGYSFSFSYIVK